MRIATLVVSILLASCATSGGPAATVGTLLLGIRPAKTFPVGDGRTGHELICDGAASSMANCYRSAQSMCPNGFEVIGQSESAEAAQRSLRIVCK